MCVCVWEREREREYLMESRSEQSWSHWAGSPVRWCEGKRAARRAGDLVRCLRSQSRLRMPGRTGEGDVAVGSGSFLLLKRWMILETSGRARVLMGGCADKKWVEMRVWNSGHPTKDTNVTGGVRTSSGYSSIGSDPLQELLRLLLFTCELRVSLLLMLLWKWTKTNKGHGFLKMAKITSFLKLFYICD